MAVAGLKEIVSVLERKEPIGKLIHDFSCTDAADMFFTMGEILADPKGKAVLEQAMASMEGAEEAQAMGERAQGDGKAIKSASHKI